MTLLQFSVVGRITLVNEGVGLLQGQTFSEILGACQTVHRTKSLWSRNSATRFRLPLGGGDSRRSSRQKILRCLWNLIVVAASLWIGGNRPGQR